jgi:hypothetical protein
MNPRPRALVLLCLLSAVLLSACGVPRDDKPKRVELREIPIGVRQPTEPLQVYFQFQANKLDFRLRDIPLSPTPLGRLRSVLAALKAGPTPEDRANGYSTVVTPYDVRIAAVRGSTAVVDLTAPSGRSGMDRDSLALGQLVLTLTAVPGIESVDFERDGQRLDFVFDDSFEKVTRTPVKRSTYDTLTLGIETPVIYFVRDGKVVGRERESVRQESDAANANAYLDLLVEGPVAEETADGVTSKVADFRPSVSVDSAGDVVLSIANGEAFRNLPSDADRALAIAQLLFTISAPFDQPVQIEIDGIRQPSVLGPNGTTVLTPASSADYADLQEVPIDSSDPGTVVSTTLG